MKKPDELSAPILDQDEMFELMRGLLARKRQFTVCTLFGGLRVGNDDEGWDVICHNSSYGHEEGLLESGGLPRRDDSVKGYLTAKEVLEMLDETKGK